MKEKRFCPRCKLVRFNVKKDVVLCYDGLGLGDLESGLPFLFPINYLSNHFLITGQTGTGKTRYAMCVGIEAENYPLQVPIKLLIIDVEGEWKNIIPYLKQKTEYYSVDSNLRINPFDLQDPALIRELMRETVFKGIEKEYVDLSAQMNFVLQETIRESKSMADLVQKIKTYHNHKLTNLEKTRTALLVRLDPFLRSPLKEIFLAEKSNPDFAKLGDNNTIIDLHALDAMVAYNSELRLIYNTIAAYYLRKMLSRETSNAISNLFCCDEAQLLVPRLLKKLIITESWPATEFATRLRKRACGLLLITQSISNIEKDIVKNVGTKVTFRTQDSEDLKLICDSCGFIDATEYQYLSNILVKLAPKQAVVSTLEQEPFLINSRTLEFAEFTPVSAEPIVIEKVEEEDFSTDEKAFLESLTSAPFISLTERRSLLGWNSARYADVVERLRKKNVIEEVPVKLGRGAPKILYQLSNAVPSIKHEFYVNWLCENLERRGFECSKNKVGPDIEIPEIKTAIEVELGKSNISGNLNNDVQKFARVIVCSDDNELIKRLSEQNKSEKIFFLQIHDVVSFLDLSQAKNDFVNI